MKKVGIVLINYSDYARKFLVSCRDSLRAQNYPTDLFSVYLVDNASTEESIGYLKETYSEANILARHDGNYCAASNLGFQKAIADGCEYLVALNMDTEVSTNWLEKLVEALENNPQAGIAQSLIYLAPKNEEEKKEPKINTAGNIINFLFFGFTSFYGKTLSESKLAINTYPEISYPSGCSFIIRKEVFELAGPYNEDYFMYHDDLTLGLKTRLAGWQIILAPQSVVFHKYQFGRNKKNFYYLERNRYLIYRAFYSRRARFLLAPIFFIIDLGLLGFSFVGGWGGTKLKLYRELVSKKFLQIVKNERQELKRVAKVPTKSVSNSFSGTIKFAEIDNFVLKYLVNPVTAFYWRMIKKNI